MFGMIPFGREENSLWNYLDNMERSLFTGFGDMSQFRCDIQDKGDHYLLEAELPGFQKEDISLDLAGDSLVITARHTSETEDKQKGLCAPGAQVRLVQPQLLTFPASTPGPSAPLTTAAFWK